MATLTESTTYEESIYQLEKIDAVLGGPNGPANKQGKQLANRTNWLKEQVRKLFEGLAQVRVLGEVQMLAAPGYKAADYDSNGVGKTGTSAQGWALCNGVGGTADLRGMFVAGFDPNRTDYATVGQTGGQESITLTNAQMPRHNHKGGNSQARFAKVDGKATQNASLDDSSNEINLLGGINIADEGGDQPHENRPPYYVVVFRQRIV
jgi:hypothetical protein